MGSSTTDIIIAFLPVLGTIIGSYIGVRASTKLMIYRIGLLEKKVDKHNGFAERMPIIEEIVKRIPDIENKIECLQNEMNALKICAESSKGVNDKIESLQNDITSLKLLIAQINAKQFLASDIDDLKHQIK